MSTDDTRVALTAMVREGKAAGMYADDPTRDVAAIRARAEAFRQAIDTSSDRVGVRAIKSARDVPALLDALAARDAEVGRLRETLARVEALLPSSWLIDEVPFLFADDLRDALAAAPSETPVCGWCGGPQHDPADCIVAQQAEAQRLCDQDRLYSETETEDR